MKNYIDNIIRPKIQGDGGEILFDSFDGQVLTVIMKGECSKCLILDRCVNWIQSRIESDLNKKVTVNAVRKKPFFWDT